jgi:type I restriction enzyme, S subunit
MSEVPLGSALSVVRSIVEPGARAGVERFVGMEHIESGTGRRLGWAEIDLAAVGGAKQRFSAGNIVYGRLRPNLNKVWLANFDGYCSVDQAVFHVNDGFDPGYVFQYMLSASFRDRVLPLIRGELPRVRVPELLAIQMPTHTYDQQRRIADRLSSWLTLFEQLKRSSEAQSDAFARTRESIVEQVLAPRRPGWDIRTIGEVSLFVTDGTHQPPRFSSNGIPFLFVRNIVSGSIDFDQVGQFVSHETFAELTKRRAPQRGDVLFSAVGSFGIAAEVTTDRSFTFQRHIAHIRPDTRRIIPGFLTAFLNSRAGRAQSEAAAVGGAQRTVTLGSLLRFELNVPSITEQRQILSHIDSRMEPVRRAADAIEQRCSAIDDLRGALVTRAFGRLEAPRDDQLRALRSFG